MKKRAIFQLTQILESVYVPGRNIYLMYIKGKHQGYPITFLEF